MIISNTKIGGGSEHMTGAIAGINMHKNYTYQSTNNGGWKGRNIKLEVS